MNLTEIQKLTDEELRIKVAKAAGWKKVWDPTLRYEYAVSPEDKHHAWYCWDDRRGTESICEYEGGIRRFAPNYPQSLDAIAPLVRELKGLKQLAFSRTLHEIAGNGASYFTPSQEIFDCLTATPRQWCIAYLVAKGE